MSYFINVCVTCLENSNELIIIGSPDANGRSIEDELKYFVPEFEFDSNILKYICTTCEQYLSIIYKWKKTVLQNMTACKKYAQQVTTNDGSYKNLSVTINPDFVIEEEISDENIYDTNILEAKNETDKDFIIKEEINEELESEKSESDDTCINKENVLSEKSEGSSAGNENISKKNEKEQYECYTCHKIYSTKIKLKKHILSHSTVPYKRQNNDKKMNNYSDLTRDVHKSYDTCKICKKSFRNLKVHYRIHSDEKPYTCDLCNRSFRRLYTLQQHRLIHGEKSHTCETCNKSFRRRHALDQHKLIHTGEKPYTCEVCKGSFRSSFTLKVHMRIHTGEKPYACEDCNKSFSHLSNLKKHRLVP